MRKLNLAMILVLLGIAGLAHAAAPGTLKSQKVKGLSRYCAYSDGGVVTIDHKDLCPDKNPAPTKSGSPPDINIKHRGNPEFGPLTGQKIKGQNRYCTYAEGSVLTVEKNESCPKTNR